MIAWRNNGNISSPWEFLTDTRYETLVHNILRSAWGSLKNTGRSGLVHCFFCIITLVVDFLMKMHGISLVPSSDTCKRGKARSPKVLFHGAVELGKTLQSTIARASLWLYDYWRLLKSNLSFNFLYLSYIYCFIIIKKLNFYHKFL